MIFLEEKKGPPGDSLACLFTNGARSRGRTYRPSVQEGWPLRILHTCEEPASIFPEPVNHSPFDMATQPSFGKVELDIDQRHLFTESIAA
jgi:hypothetical protein